VAGQDEAYGRRWPRWVSRPAGPRHDRGTTHHDRGTTAP